MATQSCANCGKSLDTSVYVSGQRVPCPGCGLSVTIERSDVSQLKAAVGAPAPKAESKVEPKPEAKAEPKPVGGETNAGPNRPTIAASTEGGPAPEQDGEKATVVRTAIKVPGYDLLHILGRGGMGEVWRAKQLSLGREVAVKILAPDLAKDPTFVKRFEKEAAALASLGHPNIVQIIDRGQTDGLYYFTMEFVHGRSLRDLMTEKKLSASDALKIVAQISHAIDYAHEHGVIHRDLKPENILVSTDGQVKVADFGLAGMRDEKFNVTNTSMTMGTLNYMAPEQRKDAKSVDGRADLYSLGVMLYELLTGEVPVGRFKLPSEKITHLDARIDDIVAKALEPDPAARFQRASHIGKELEGLLSTVSLPASALPSAPPPVPDHAKPTEAVVEPPTHISAVAKHALNVGRVARGLVMGFLLFLGIGVLLDNFFGIHLYEETEDGITIGRLITIKNPRAHPAAADAGAVEAAAHPEPATTGGKPPAPAGADALPTDTEHDVTVGAHLIKDPGGTLVVESDLHPGTEASLVALQGNWEATPAGLVGRVFNRLQKEGSKPRATLEEPSFRLAELTAEVKVSVDDKVPSGYDRRRAPTAFLNFHSKDMLLQLAMELGETPVYRGTWKALDESGKAQLTTFGDPEFEELRPPRSGEVTLKLVSKRGYLTVFANNEAILSKAVKLPEGFTLAVGRVGVGCEEATCTFRDFRVEGQPVSDRELGDDTHTHTVAEVGAPQAAHP